jgi:site-specific recombinase XerD
VFLNQQEYKALLYEAQRRGRARDEAILMTLIQCGLREGELVRLELSDVDLAKRELHLRGRKGGVDTDIPLVEAAVEALRNYLAVRPNIPHSKVFVSSRSAKPLAERAIRYLVKYYMKRAGIRKQASTHTLRTPSAPSSRPRTLILRPCSTGWATSGLRPRSIICIW